MPLSRNAMAPKLEAREITIRYFAWVREKVGLSEELVMVPLNIETIGDLARWMQSRGDSYASAFANPDAIRAAIDHKHVQPMATIAAAREIGFFPPVTGG
jgi:molybdopterin synthase sulfur carrier subunit